MSRVNSLIHRFLEDPMGLEDHELDQLLALLRDHPHRAIELREQLLLDDFLSQKLAIDRQNFFAQIEQRVADFERGQEEMYDHVAELRAIAEAEIDKPLRQSVRGAWLKYSLSFAVVLSLLLAVAAWQWSQSQPKPVAIIEEVSGEVTIIRGSQRVTPQLGKAVFTGDQLVSTAASTIEWKYKDETTVRIVGDAVSFVSADRQTGAKQVQLDQGELVASVAAQVRGPMVFSTPHATATVRGTQLRLVVGRADTQLDVTEGQVDLTRRADGKTIPVAASETAIASTERIAIKLPDWPVNRSQAIYLFQGDPQNTLCRNPASGNFRQSELTSQKAIGAQEQKLVLTGTWFTAAEDGADITTLIKQSGEFACEVVLVPQAAQDNDSGVFLSLGPSSAPSLELRQEGAWLLARTSPNGSNSIELTIGEVTAGQRTHVILSGRNGSLVSYVDGVQTAEKHDVLLDTATWTSGPLTLGADANGEHSWPGHMEGLAFFSRYLNVEEVRHERERFELVHPK